MSASARKRLRLTDQTSDDGDHSSKEAIQNDEQTTQQIISDLEHEIELLEWRLKQFRDDWKQQKKDRASLSSLNTITDEIHELEQLVKENEILSGLTLSEVSYSVLKQDGTSSHRQHQVMGEAGGMQFELQYDVIEQFQKTKTEEPCAEVATVEVNIRDDMVALLEAPLHRAADDKNVRELFQLLSSYGRWLEDRERAINHFASTFPELVQRVDEGDEGCNISMVIADVKQDVKLHVLWGLKLLPMKSVVPDLQLQVEASPKVLDKDKKGVLVSAPEVFQLMLKKFGIESALHMLVKLMDEAPP